MNKGLNIFLVVFLCVISYVGLLLSFYSSDDSETWNPKMGYAMPTGRTYGTSAVSVDESSTGSDVAAISVRSANSMFHHRPSFSYAPASTPAYSQSPIGGTSSNSVASPIYATSSAEFHSFGGGGNTGGVSMSGGVVSSNSQSTIASTQLSAQGGGFNAITTSSSTSFNASSFNNLINISPNSLIASLPASNYQGITVMGGSRGIRGRLSAGPATNTSDWLNWLVLNGYGTPGADGIWGLDIYQLRQAYDDYVRNWNSTMGGKQPPTWDEWLSWFMGSEDDPYGWTNDGGDTYSYYKYVPVGDATLLVLFALLYAVVLIIRRRKATLS